MRLQPMQKVIGKILHWYMPANICFQEYHRNIQTASKVPEIFAVPHKWLFGGICWKLKVNTRRKVGGRLVSSSGRKVGHGFRNIVNILR